MTMITNRLNQKEKFAVCVFCAVLFTLLAFVAANAQNEISDTTDSNEILSSSSGYDLTGTWELTITPDDGSPSFNGFYTFNSDGNASFSSAGPPIPALGNPGYRVWKKTRYNRFASTIRMNSYDEKFQFAGTLKINAKIRLTSHDTFVTEDQVTVIDPDGNVIVVLGGSAQGRRMEVEIY